MRNSILLLLIVVTAVYLGFISGGAHVAKEFDEKYQAVKADLDWLYEGQCSHKK